MLINRHALLRGHFLKHFDSDGLGHYATALSRTVMNSIFLS
jgi:hypothetical protein